MRRRLWLVAPVLLLSAADIGLTLQGQSPAYWAGDYHRAEEANPIAYPLLARSPWLFAGFAAVWLACVSVAVLWWRHPASGWLAVSVALAHAVGGSGWLFRIEPWGLVLAGGYLALAAQGSAWCYGRFARTPRAESGVSNPVADA